MWEYSVKEIKRIGAHGLRVQPLVVVTVCIFLVLQYTNITILVLGNFNKHSVVIENEDVLRRSKYIFEGFNNETGTRNGEYIIPNIIHYLKLNQSNFTFVDAVCVLSALKNHRPDKVMFHTNVKNFVGPYWGKVKTYPGLVYEIHNVTLPNEIFGQNFSNDWYLWHASDVTRIRILMEHGGIFLDNDVYVVQKLDKFRKFEMAIGWDEGQCIGIQVLFANKNARFLRLWLDTYRQYHPNLWYYNGGCKPTKEVLCQRPELVHRVKLLFGVHSLIRELYMTHQWKDWQKQYTVHLLIRHRANFDKYYSEYPDFDENNIRRYPMSFAEMAKEAYGINARVQ